VLGLSYVLKLSTKLKNKILRLHSHIFEKNIYLRKDSHKTWKNIMVISINHLQIFLALIIKYIKSHHFIMNIYKLKISCHNLFSNNITCITNINFLF